MIINGRNRRADRCMVSNRNAEEQYSLHCLRRLEAALDSLENSTFLEVEPQFDMGSYPLQLTSINFKNDRYDLTIRADHAGGFPVHYWIEKRLAERIREILRHIPFSDPWVGYIHSLDLNFSRTTDEGTQQCALRPMRYKIEAETKIEVEVEVEVETETEMGGENYGALLGA